MARKWLFVIITVIAVGVGWRILRPSANYKLKQPKILSPVAVPMLIVKAVDSQVFNEFAGTVQSSVTAQIAPRIVAHIREMAVKSGDLVKKGEILVRLDDGDIRARIKQARAAITAAEATRDEAQQNLRRYQELVRSNIESQQALDQAEARAKNAVAALESVRQQLSEIQENLSYTEILAPFDAIVVDKFAQPKELASPGRVILTLQDPTRLRLEAPVSEQCARRIHVGDPALVKVASAEAELETAVSEIVPAVDPKSRSFIVRADLPYHADLKPGMFGRLRFPCAPRRLLAIPNSAIVRRGQLDLVFVVSENTARLRLIRVGESLKDMVEVLAGLKEGEVIVDLPPEDLRDGRPVEGSHE